MTTQGIGNATARPGHTMNIDAMNTEWYVWRAMCEELALLGVDINKQDSLANAIRRWGEELVQLRHSQWTEPSTAAEGGTIPENALRETRRQYPDDMVTTRVEQSEIRARAERRPARPIRSQSIEGVRP